MLKPPPSRLLQTLRQLGQRAAPQEGGDAELLGRFARDRDEAAFEELMRRHAGMVLRTCRRYLGPGPDADDAFQAVFLALARDAGRITHRESLAGWLFRVAYHVSRKLMGQNARRRLLTVRDGDCPRPADADALDREELRAAVEQEVGSLPDRLRGPVVLCYLEGRSNSEAAALLGCPKGTVDSRLSEARRRLRVKLLRRGVALAGTGAFESLWSSEGAAAAPGLARCTLEAAVLLARSGSAAGAVTEQVLSLVAGVSQIMSTNRLTLMLAAAVLLATMGGAGLTVFTASAESKKPPAKPETAKKPEKPKADAAPPTLAPSGEGNNESVQKLLRQPLGLDDIPQAMQLKDFLLLLQERFKVPIRIDLSAFARVGIPGSVQLYDREVRLPVVRGMTVADALHDALAQLTHDDANTRPMTFRVRNGQIAIVPAFQPSLLSVGAGEPGGGSDGGGMMPEQRLEQDEGEPISLAVEEKPFAEVLRELRQTTGANIVLDVREKEKARVPVSATINDVRLMAALRVLGDMCDLQPVALNNVFYVTSKENAEKLQKEIDRRRYGEPQNLGGLGGFGPAGGGLGGGFGGAAPANPAPMPPPKKADKPSGM